MIARFLSSRRSSKLFVVVIAVSLLSTTVSINAASGAMYSFLGCNDRIIPYYFSDDGDGVWVDTSNPDEYIDWARETLSTLNDADGLNSNQLVNVYEVSSTNPPAGATPVELRWVDDANEPGLDDISTINGTMACQSGNNYLYINPNNASTKARFQRTMQHEMGHMTGLRHTGKADSSDGQYPVMSTCLTNSEAEAFGSGATELKKDTRVHMNLIHDPPTLDQVSANPRYDDSLKYWLSNSTMTLSTAAGGIGSGRYLKAKGNTSLAWQNYFYQSARIWDGSQTPSYGLRYSFKEEVQSNQSKIGYKTFFRVLVDFAYTSTGCNSSVGRYDYGNRRLNKLSTDGSGPEVTGWLLAHNSGMQWVYSATWIDKVIAPVAPATLNSSITNGDGYDIQLRIHTRSVRPSDGTLRPIHFDNVTLVGDI